MHRVVVGVLNLLEEFAIVGEQASAAAGGDQFLHNADGEVSFAGPNAADE